MNYVADTHALLWWFTEDPRIGSEASKAFEKCEEGEAVIFIPSIVIAESLDIFEKRRIKFDFNKLIRKIKNSDNFLIVPLDIPILKKMVALSDVSELHDRIIASTAKHLKATVITVDHVLRDSSLVKTVW